MAIPETRGLVLRDAKDGTAVSLKDVLKRLIDMRHEYGIRMNLVMLQAPKYPLQKHSRERAPARNSSASSIAKIKNVFA